MTTRVSEPETVAPSGAPLRPRTRVLIAVAVLVLALLAATVLLSVRVIGSYSDRERGDTVTAIAREVAVKMLTISPGGGQSMMDAVGDQASGSFKQQLIAQNDEFTQAVRNAKVSSEGTVTESAVQYATDGNASVLLTADATVKNAQAPNGESKQYRIVVQLERLPGAPWTVSKLDFAP